LVVGGTISVQVKGTRRGAGDRRNEGVVARLVPPEVVIIALDEVYAIEAEDRWDGERWATAAEVELFEKGKSGVRDGVCCGSWRDRGLIKAHIHVCKDHAETCSHYVWGHKGCYMGNRAGPTGACAR
jgi:hypothetical protein